MNSSKGTKFFRYAIPVIRIIIGMAFVLSGIFKLIDLKAFQKVIDALGLLVGPLPLLVSILIPVLELVLGIMLATGIYIRITAVHLNVLVVIFSWVTFYILRSRPDMQCGCFGSFFDMTFSIYHFIVLFVIFILNLIVIIEPNDSWTLQKVFREKISAARKMLIVEVLTYVLITLGIVLIGFAIYMNFWGQRGQETSTTDDTGVLIEQQEEQQEVSSTEVLIDDNGQEEKREASGTEVLVDDAGQEGQQEASEENDIAEIMPITVDEAYDAYMNDQDFIFVDVRSESEYNSGHIKGALLIPVSDIGERMDELPRDKSIIVYCNGSSCNRSGHAAAILVDNGFEKVYDLIGNGINEWISKGYPSE